MKTIFTLLKPALQLVLLVLPGLFLMILGILWLIHRHLKRNRPPS